MVNPQIQVVSNVGMVMKDIKTRASVSEPDNTRDFPYPDGISSASDGYLYSGDKFMPYTNTSQMGRYKVWVKDYDSGNGTIFYPVTPDMLEPQYDDFVVSDKSKNLVADHYFSVNYSNYIWNIDKSAWVTNNGIGKWVSYEEMYRIGEQAGSANNAKGDPFPNKFRLKVSVVEKYGDVAVLNGNILLRYFPTRYF